MKKLVIVIFVFTAALYTISQSKAAKLLGAENDQHSQILGATVQIKLIKPEGNQLGSQNQIQIRFARGLGTLLEDKDQVFIVTHDHWGEMLLSAELVEFRDANGDLLAETSGLFFRNLIRYRDKGTLVFQAPVELEPIFSLAVKRGEQRLIQTGLDVDITRIRPGKREVEVISAQVTGVSDQSGVLTYELINHDGTDIVKGDSGGGIWSDGNFIANMWWAVVQETVVVGTEAVSIASREGTGESGAAAFTEEIETSLDEQESDMLSGARMQHMK